MRTSLSVLLSNQSGTGMNKSAVLGTGQVAQLVRTSLPYIKVVGLIPGQGTYKNQPMNASISGTIALARVAQWIESGRANQGVTVSIPSQGMCLDCGPGSQ